MFIVIVGIEYLNEKRRDRALKYYNEISTTVILADTLGMDLECSDNKGNTWVMKGNIQACVWYSYSRHCRLYMG